MILIRFKFTVNIVVAPCIYMSIRPEDDAISYPCMCFNSLFFASILYRSFDSIELNINNNLILFFINEGEPIVD